ncbi:eukaryotic translation initiation factor 5B [Polyodon spathula]|uniref:eukaryotic translation initiation factor 5B n=1 Tax=Polyodon spathula TaxID=7913 RepID=UPI001B7DE261|nr:eukaryotic translation initiation factor 5B [Polyodon spathula]
MQNNNGFPLAGPSSNPRKRQVRFSARHDIMLLREVIAQNPFSSKEPGRVWAKVGELITAALQDESFEVDARRCRERTALLLDYYKKQDFPSLRRFGTERLYAQKEDLLHEVLELEAEKGLLGSAEGKYQDEMPAELRKRALEELAHQESEKPEQPLPGLGQAHTGPAAPEVEEQEQEQEQEELPDIPAPMAKRACQCCCQTYSEILTFLEKRSDAEQRLREEEMALRREELEIQRGKITLERERLEAERRERERRFQLESQERQVILDLLKDRVVKY